MSQTRVQTSRIRERFFRFPDHPRRRRRRTRDDGGKWSWTLRMSGHPAATHSPDRSYISHDRRTGRQLPRLRHHAARRRPA
ncbi:hypothetical protein SBRY_11171 [Actinacidiphila bryophytorum]|uniref:Uncharacterized protein n=1 Tax=Actinacidiphila bryophytorum TaxID=1436133 RepID=A0A9W4E740_9ACTN|nr:hypothetical protein SBRY_11171 [Actinacidiphila bryophytorum]